MTYVVNLSGKTDIGWGIMGQEQAHPAPMWNKPSDLKPQVA